MFEKLRSLDWVYIVLIILGLRALIDSSFPQALIVICFAGIKAYTDYLKTREVKDLEKETKLQIEELKNQMAGLSVKNVVKPSQSDLTSRRFF